MLERRLEDQEDVLEKTRKARVYSGSSTAVEVGRAGTTVKALAAPETKWLGRFAGNVTLPG